MKRAPHSLLVRGIPKPAPATWRVGALALASMLAIGCGDRSGSERESQTRTSFAASAIGSDIWRALAPAQRAARIRELQASAGPDYAAQLTAPGVLHAAHPGMRLRAAFEAGRVSLLVGGSLTETATPIELAAVAWGCRGEMQALPVATPLLSPAHPGGVEYRHADFDEWYVLGPAGLEQGFTIRRLPGCAVSGSPLRIQLAFQGKFGLSEQPLDAPDEALLSAPGSRVIHYGEAFATDADGTEFAPRIDTSPALALELDARAATLPLVIDPLAWLEQSKLTASAGAVGDRFGSATAISGDTALVGASGDDQLASDAGSAYIFVRSGSTWTLQQKLLANDGAAADSFGSAVALSGDTAVIGAPGDDNGAADTGSAYVFVRTGSVWSLRKKLSASDPQAGDRFGAAVAVSGSFAVVGVPLKDNGTAVDAGAGYVFQGSGATWTQQAKLLPSSGADAHTGAGVAISGTRLALGSDRASGFQVSFYTLQNGAWGAGESVESSLPTYAHLGAALAMSPNYTVVGGYTLDPGSATPPGLALVIQNSAVTAQSLLKAADAAAGDQFGSSVAISDNDTILIGAAQDDDQGTDSGSAYVFTFGTAWTQQQKLIATDGAALDVFGSAVSLSGGSALIGAPSQGGKAGAVYVESLAADNGAACTLSRECGSGFCVEGVCCDGACNGPCRSCLRKNKANNSGADGVCGNVRANTDPLDACPTTLPGTCGNSGMCDGKGACASYGSGTSCTYSACASANSATLNSACSGVGECKPIATVPCSLGYLCVSAVCKSGCSVDTDCDKTLGFLCTPAGFCKKPKGTACANDDDCSTGTCQWGSCCLANVDGVCIKPLGIACTANGECASGACSDNVCCNSTCGGQCESCALPASVGTCSPAFGVPPCAAEGGAAGQGGASSGGGAQGGSAQGGSAQGGSAQGGSAQGGSSGFPQSGANGAGLGQGASSGFAQGGASGGAGMSGSGGRAGTGTGTGTGGATARHPGVTLECLDDSDCPSDLGCDRNSNTCQDKLVVACGCRVVGEHRAPTSSLVLIAGTALLGVSRRKRRAARAA